MDNVISVQTFSKDLAIGESVEQELLQIIRKKYINAEKIPGNHKTYDFYIPEVNMTIEVKADLKSDQTGNFFIECEFNGEPSGIEATTAQWWILVDSTNYYFIETETLGYLIQMNRCPKRTWRGNDGPVVSSYLLRKSIIQTSPYVTVMQRKTH